MSIEESFSIEEAARALHVSVKTIRRMIDRGEIEVFRVGRQIRIRKSVIERLQKGQ
jgi:excisionase family DNA binding protein